MEDEYHAPVLVDEVLRYLQPSREGVYVDGTLGGGGHAEAILINSTAHSVLYGFDADSEAIEHARHRLGRFGERIQYVHDNAARLRTRLEELHVPRIQGLLLDLGVSSHQIDAAERGFSFQQEHRIDMRMDRRQGLDGWTVVNTYPRERLSDLLWQFGDERKARKIAAGIVRAREQHPVDSTGELARIVESAAGGRYLQKSLARVFQAIRIEVNSELDNLRKILKESVELMERGGCIVVIAYHSLEDRIVKEFFRWESSALIPSGTRLMPDRAKEPRLRILTRKPVVPGGTEVARNPRAVSAKLRAAERI